MATPALGVPRLVMLPVELTKEFFADPTTLIPYNWSIEKESILAAVFIIAGVVLKNTEKQLKKPTTMRGPLLFILGWVMFANAVARNGSNQSGPDSRKLVPYLGAAVIVTAVMFMQQVMKKYASDSKTQMTKMRPLVFAFVAGWLLFAYSFSQNLGLAFLSAGAVFLSMLYFLPKQRALNVVDGPGLPLFCFAWGGLIVANSTLFARSIVV
jgi:hypothetical protein